MTVEIKVLIVGPLDLKELMLSISKEYPILETSYITYTFHHEITDIVQAHQDSYDVLLFAGSLPYAITKEQLNLEKRMVYVPFKGTALYRVLFQLIRTRSDKLLAGHLNISIDNLEKFEVEECFDELSLSYNNIYFENSLDQDTEQLVHFHYHLFQMNKIDVAITSIGSVYKKLKEKGVPTSRIIPTRSSIRSSLEKVLMEGINLQQSNAQLATGIITWNRINQSESLTEYQVQRKILKLKNILINYGEETQAIIKWMDEHQEVKFITTRGALELQHSQASNELKLLEEIFRKAGISPRMGVGIGRTANEAETHAREALEKAPKDELVFFIRDVEGMVHGPIGREINISYSIRNDNPELLKLSKLAELSHATINRVLSFCQIQGGYSITTADLASGLGITTRSARRILNKLEQANLAIVTGEEQPVKRGRPRQVYSLERLHEAVRT